MQEAIFRKKVSKGSRFNQVYVPKSVSRLIEVGDLVEVRLLEKHKELYYGKKQPRLGWFKENMIKEIFNFLNKKVRCGGIFVVGSFLTKAYGFNDLDLAILGDKDIDVKRLEDCLVKEFNQKFHMLVYKKEELEKALAYDPITASMFSIYISDRPIDLEYKYSVNRKHILFLLMMPEDLLRIKLSSKIFYDALRRLATIEHFLNKKSLLIAEIDKELEHLLKEDLYASMKSDQPMSDKELEIIRGIIKEKVMRIKKWVKTKTWMS